MTEQQKPPPAAPEGAFSVILRCSPCWVSALRLLGDGALAGLVVAGTELAVAAADDRCRLRRVDQTQRQQRGEAL